MAEKKAYLVSTAQGAIQAISSIPRSEQVRPLLKNLLGKNAEAARNVQEIHWHGGEDEYWLNRLGEPDGFGPDLARFYWPPTPLLTHTMLQSSARAVESGDLDLLILAQESAGQAVLLLLASSPALKRYGFSPQARIGAKLVLSGAQDTLLKSARSGLEGAGQEMNGLKALASARKISGAQEDFPSADWILPGKDLPGGDLFLTAALAGRLSAQQVPAVALISSGAQKSGLLTVLERA